ncbi:hypothetical protein AA637_08240 [Cyanobacterium sp. HL-69]|uniref:hypothetical protein n=1 Tax=Cyanobacterium sp. HL-69 TaxID=2054282 RepID=UPI000CA3E414|nr:hypothetical protein AA637_08240 [Cyanobacterium sp. HL-69]
MSVKKLINHQVNNLSETDLIVGKKTPALLLESLSNSYQDWLVNLFQPFITFYIVFNQLKR